MADNKPESEKTQTEVEKPAQIDPNVEITALAAAIEKVPAEQGMTVAEALKRTKAKIRVPKNGKIFVNGAVGTLTTLVKGGDKIVVSPKNANGTE